MKCQNCGKNEVNFHYSTNVNGAVTETHLCSECAAQSGYDIESMFDLGSMFDDMLPIHKMLGRRSGISGFMPMAVPVMSADAVFPFKLRQHRGGELHGGLQGDLHGGAGVCGHCTETKKGNVEVDENMSKLRELNVQMRLAIESEEFERAAEIRDQIKELKTSAVGEVK